MKLLICNAGSTSLKFRLYEMPQELELLEAKIERVGSPDSAIYHFANCRSGHRERRGGLCVPGYAEGIGMFLADAVGEHGALGSLDELEAVGFKTVLARGFYGTHELTDEVLGAMRACLTAAPAHNGPYLEAIGVFQRLTPGARLIGAFETDFHRSIPRERSLYALPYDWAEKYGIRRMGYHGASHSYVAETLTELYGATGRTVSCHLGGSCSVCAIEDGKSVDTSFGLSLQTGVMHSNRAGDFDACAIPCLMAEGLGMDEILEGVSKRGGLLGISGVSGDLRQVEAAADEGNARARLAIDMFTTSILRYVGAFTAELGGLDRLAFTGGIGENSARVRGAVCRALGFLGLELDETRNAAPDTGIREISAAGSRVQALVIPANEELGVARRCYRACFE